MFLKSHLLTENGRQFLEMCCEVFFSPTSDVDDTKLCLDICGANLVRTLIAEAFVAICG